MICEIVLTPNQAKRIISKAIIELSYVQKALQDGMMVIHPSSTTYFILYELFGKVPEGIWVSGVIKKGALCISRERQDLGTKGETPSHPFDFPFSWVLEKGKLKMERIKLGVLLNEMGPGDIYVKGCNAVDAHRQAGVLFASPGGGTVAQVMKAAQRKGFRFILPVGLEKMISIPIGDAAQKSSYDKIDKSMGQRVGLMPVNGEVICEDQAINILTGCTAVQIASGGLEEAQGATILAVSGEAENMERMWQLIHEISKREVRVPALKETDCSMCPRNKCSYFNLDAESRLKTISR
ncbi:hypothetical protein [Candidatus Formimonas warabiya]|uniref:Uncharacterized protein n=1 Tax=Formimonas warabiya TaxID=1761012 RepID=A0A3G1KSC3_FORW1|nr:hypothetical protein [Candidatus Formimonas warabiya]ATW25413.1 hypothetical protein DCMF_12080 [Candidatus Formimonas warabiya]